MFDGSRLMDHASRLEAKKNIWCVVDGRESVVGNRESVVGYGTTELGYGTTNTDAGVGIGVLRGIQTFN